MLVPCTPVFFLYFVIVRVEQKTELHRNALLVKTVSNISQGSVATH